MSAIRIFRWHDAPDEYRVVPERAWLAYVPDGRDFDAAVEAGWVALVTSEAPGGIVVAGNERGNG